MNFPGPINSDPSSVSAVALDSRHFVFTPKQHHGAGPDGSDAVVVPDANLLFSGHYAREGNDLVLSGPDQKYVVQDYFKNEKRPALVSQDGAALSAHIVSSLTGNVQYAQTTAPDAAQVIGHVMKLSGSASAIRNGVAVTLNIGDAVQKGDVIETGSDSSIAMTLIDGSAFGMTANARMVLNELVYDPNGSSNSSFISLVQGTITFVAGQTAKNGNMRVETPVATMGIRGTAVLVKIDAIIGNVAVSLGVEPDGHVGGLAFYDNTTGALIGTMSQSGQVTIITPAGIGQPPSATEQTKTTADIQADKSLFQQVFQLYFPNYNPDDSKPKTNDHPRTDIGVPSVLGKLGIDPDTGRPNITYTITVTNPDTHTTSELRITFINTPPIFKVTDAVDVQSTLASNQFRLGDHVQIIDPDINTAPFFDVPIPYVKNTGQLVGGIANDALGAPSTVTYGNFMLNSALVNFDPVTGIVTYSPDGFRFLGEGETAVYTFTFTAASGVANTGSDTGHETLLLTITGENDAPQIVAASTTAAGNVKEDCGADSGHHLNTSGLVTFQDFDFTDGHTVAMVRTSTTSTAHLPGFVDDTTEVGTFTITPLSENLTDTDDHGTVGWSFTLDNDDPIVQSLAEGQKIIQTYTITITDTLGVSVDQIVTITITGTNDAPALVEDTTLIHQANEIVNSTNSTTDDIVSGALAFADVDLTDTHQATAALHPGALSVVWSGGSYGDIPADTIAELDAAMTATIADSTGTGSGTLNWTFKLPDHLFDFLGHHETLTLIYDVTVADYNNGVATGTSSTEQVTVQITANNDRPNIVTLTAAATVQEDVAPDADNFVKGTGTVTFSDADLGDKHQAHVVYNNDVTPHNGATVSIPLAAALGTALTVPSGQLAAGVHTFDWNFAIDNSLLQYLAAGETITATYTISVQDDSGVVANNTSTCTPNIVTVTITGTNDAPVVSGAVVDLLVVEDGGTSTLDALAHATDVDEGTVLSVVNVPGVDAAGTLPPGVTYDALHHTFTLNPGDAAYQYLAEGDKLVVTVSYGVTDGVVTTPTPASVSWTITGTNDTPFLSASLTSATYVDTVAPDHFDRVTGQLTTVDADIPDTATYGITGGTSIATVNLNGIDYDVMKTGTYGSLYLNDTTGDYTFIPLDAAIEALQTNASEDFELTVTDSASATDSKTLTIHVQGVDDAPIAVGDPVDISAVSNLFTITGTVTGNDHDADDTFEISSASFGPISGAVAPDSEGIIRLAGTFGTLLLFTTAHSGSTTLGSLSVPGDFVAGDYEFVVGYDLNGDPISNSPIATLKPGDAPLTDQFQYTITDSHGEVSAAAPIDITYDLNPIQVGVATTDGFDTTSLWNELKNGDLVSATSTTVTLTFGTHTITVEGVGITSSPTMDGVELTGGVIHEIHVTDTATSNAVLDLTNLNTYATDLYNAVGPAGTQIAFDGLFNTHAFDVHGNAGNDVLYGGDFNDRIDTAGGADIVNAGNGNDLIIVHDNSAWQIDGGDGIDTIQFAGQFDLQNAPVGQSLSGIEIFDLNKTDANAIDIVAEGVAQINDAHVIRVLGNGDDTVTLNPLYSGDSGTDHPNGHWTLTNADTLYTADGLTAATHFAQYDFQDGSDTLATLYVEQGVNVDLAPAISSDGLQISGLGGPLDPTTILGLSVSDDSGDVFHITATAASGSSVTEANGDPLPATALSFSQVNDILTDGILYTPTVPGPAPANDVVTIHVADDHGLSDTLNFVFQQNATGPATLTGSDQKDFIFATDSSGDLLTGGANIDNFVFRSGTGHDTITDFVSGTDKIVLNGFGSTPSDFSTWLSSHASAAPDTLELNGTTDQLTLSGVVVANLHANDFIFHA